MPEAPGREQNYCLTAMPDLVLATSLWSLSLCIREELGRAVLHAKETKLWRTDGRLKVPNAAQGTLATFLPYLRPTASSVKWAYQSPSVNISVIYNMYNSI